MHKCILCAMAVESLRIGERLKSLRSALDWTQLDLARFLTEMRGASVTQAQVSNWESGAHMHRSTAAFLMRAIADAVKTKKRAS